MIRRIEGLRWAKPSESGPRLPTSRAKGAKAAGLRYERALARALSPQGWCHGQWWEFEDRRGHGWGQTDLWKGVISHIGGVVVLLEAKYTYTRDGWEQLDGLYKPVVEMATGRRVVGVEVCKALTPQVEECEVTGELGEAIRLAVAGKRVVLHWLGMGLVPQGASFGVRHIIPGDKPVTAA